MSLKRIFIFVICFLLLFSSCSNSEKFNTQAIYFDEKQIQEHDLVEKQICLDEHTQIYKDNKGLTHYYIYASPLEKSNCKLQDSVDGYIYDGNFVSNCFPKELSKNNNINIVKDTQSIAIFPVDDRIYSSTFKTNKNVFGLKRECIEYKDFFGKNTEMICYACPFGINFEIVLNKKLQSNKFNLKIRIPDVVPDTSSLDYITMNTLYGKTKLKINTPLLVYKKGWNYENSVKLIDKENDIYTIEYSINEELFENDNLYPMVLNQSIYVHTDKQPDTSVYKKFNDKKFYLSPYMVFENIRGKNNTYIRFDNLSGLDIDYKTVVSAKYILRNLFKTNDTINMGVYAVKEEWCSINSNWDNKANYDGQALDIQKINKAGDYGFDITKHFKKMLKNGKDNKKNHTLNKGFMLKVNSKSEKILLASGDNGIFSPYLEIVTR